LRPNKSFICYFNFNVSQDDELEGFSFACFMAGDVLLESLTLRMNGTIPGRALPFAALSRDEMKKSSVLLCFNFLSRPKWGAPKAFSLVVVRLNAFRQPGVRATAEYSKLRLLLVLLHSCSFYTFKGDF
jgi:hypothetical protein